jgi:hypothetical protein
MPITTATSYRTKHTDFTIFKTRVAAHATAAGISISSEEGHVTFQDFLNSIPKRSSQKLDRDILETEEKLRLVEDELQKIDSNLQAIAIRLTGAVCFA